MADLDRTKEDADSMMDSNQEEINLVMDPEITMAVDMVEMVDRRIRRTWWTRRTRRTWRLWRTPWT